MSESGQGGDPNSPSGDQPYKSFESEDDFKSFQSKTFSNGYNNMQQKAIERIGSTLGLDVDPNEDGAFDKTLSSISEMQKKISESVSDPTKTDEYISLQDKYKELQNNVKTLQQEKESVTNQYKIDSSHNQAVSKLKETSEFVIPEDKAKKLFDIEHKVQWKDGKPVTYSTETGQPIMDDNGNYKPLSEVQQDFYKSFVKPTGQGTGGGSGDGGGVKPKYKDFTEAVQSGNDNRAQELIQKANDAGGWSEPDAPKIG